ncbi:MAG: HEAT repeat domain-containing protein [Candidatus Heimdallarchaeota archaeon]
MTKSISVLMRNLYDQNPEVRGKAAMDLGENLAVEALSSLVKVMMNDENTGVRSLCAEALGTIAEPTVLPELVAALANETEEKVRQSISWAIEAIARKEGLTKDEALKKFSKKRSGILKKTPPKTKPKESSKATEQKKVFKTKQTCSVKISSNKESYLCDNEAKFWMEMKLDDNLTVIIPLCEEHHKMLEKD